VESIEFDKHHGQDFDGRGRALSKGLTLLDDKPQEL
jgi:hypothetical protein